MFVIFAAPLLSDNAFRMISAIAALEGVRLGVITHDGAEKSRDLQGRVAHWRVDNVLDAPQLLWAAHALQERNGRVHRLFGAYEQLQVPLAVARPLGAQITTLCRSHTTSTSSRSGRAR